MVKVNIRRYEAPVTHRVLVELEDGVCEASVINPDKETNGRIEHHSVDHTFGYTLNDAGNWTSVIDPGQPTPSN